MEAEGDAKPGARKKGPYLMQLILISFPEAYKTSTIVVPYVLCCSVHCCT